MERLTTNKPVSEMNMVELAHNCCYADKDMNARYRDFENDISARDFAKTLLLGSGYDDFSYKDEPFDMEMHENLFFDPFTDDRGMIALIYRNLWAMADLRERLKYYEDLEEQGLLLRLPCKVGDVVYQITRDIVSEFRIKTFVCDNKTFFFHWECIKGIYKNVVGFHSSRIGVDVFLTKEEAEKALAEMRKHNE